MQGNLGFRIPRFLVRDSGTLVSETWIPDSNR